MRFWQLGQSDQGALGHQPNLGGVEEHRRMAGGGFVVSEGSSCAPWELGQCKPVAGFSAVHALLQHGNALGSCLAVTDRPNAL